MTRAIVVALIGNNQQRIEHIKKIYGIGPEPSKDEVNELFSNWPGKK